MAIQYKNEQLLKNIGYLVKKLREDRGLSLSQIDIDYNLKMNHSIHFGRIEQGKRNINISTISLICDYFEISLSDFFIRVSNL